MNKTRKRRRLSMSRITPASSIISSPSTRRRLLSPATLTELAVCLLFTVLNTEKWLLPAAEASVACNESSICEELLRPGSECIAGFCSNPFYKGGCLSNRMSDKSPWKDRIRVCNSEDPPDALTKGYCRQPQAGLDYREVRISSQNWESAFFSAWILQIVLSEILGVPTTIETGTAEAKMNLYDPESAFGYGIANDWEGIKRGHYFGDCRPIVQQNDIVKKGAEESESGQAEYKSCVHVIPELWVMSRERVRELRGIVEPPMGMGALGHTGWHVPRYTAQQDPTLLSYLGLSGEENRKKLAETFLRPTSWKDYCDLVSLDQCQIPSNITQRPPQDESEDSRYFVNGLYTGYFRATDENNCTMNPTTCTGHIVDYPCGWAGFQPAQAYHNNIAVKSSRWVVENIDVIQKFVPASSPRVIEEEAHGVTPLSYASIILACIAAVLVLLAGITTFRLRKYESVAYAQVEFLWFLLTGLFLIAMGAIVMGIPPSNGTCITTIWLLNWGYLFDLVPLVVKVWVICQKLNAGSLVAHIVVPRRTFFLPVLIVGFFVTVFLILWTVMDPPLKKTEYQLTDSITANNETVVTVTSYCRSNMDDMWRYISVAWQSLLLLCASVLAFQSSKFLHQHIATRAFAVMTYSQLFFALIRVAAITLEDSLGASKIPRYMSLIHSADVIVVIFIYFVPKFWATARDDYQHTRRLSATYLARRHGNEAH